MDSIKRELETQILDHLIPNKVLVIVGARRVGKTILLKSLLQRVNEPYLFLNGESITTLEQLQRRSIENYKMLLQNNKILIIDEAQKIPEIGLILKLMIDEIEGLKIIVTGSSAFDIHNKLGEPLTGRKFDFFLYPFSEKELLQTNNLFQLKENLRNRIIFGNYPELLHLQEENQKINYLKNLVSSYLLKDILILENIKQSVKIYDLLKLIAFQIGGEVSYQELSNKLSLSKNTVEKYLDLLTKVYILFRLDAFGRNRRKELTKSKKYYFYDNGIRNAIISNFNSVQLRDDVGKLWENYIISERLKYRAYNNIYSEQYFGRTYDNQEIDLIEDLGGKFSAFEIKWKEQKQRIPPYWKSTYPNAYFFQINSENYFDYIGIND